VEELPNEIVNEWKKTAEKLKDFGAEIVPCSLPHIPHALSTYLIIATAEASSNLSRYDGIRFGSNKNSFLINY
jgi:aspartyl-tRNA(Asn)/glutamyl-tRNA(Gln) amidotransferase subunit A